MNNDILKSITRENCGQIIKQIRKKFGSISIMDFAKILGVSRSTIMRIEDGRTLPSDEFINRLKALQVIGLSKFKSLSEKNKNTFSQLIEETGENSDMLYKVYENMLKELTPIGILAGLGAIGGASLITDPTTLVSSVSILTSGAGYGLIKAIESIVTANKLKCTEVDGRWEIIKTKNDSRNKKGEKNE